MKKTTQKQNNAEQKRGKVLRGVVVSNKMKDTVVVDVTRFVKHPKYKKYYKVNKKYKAHDLNNTLNVGDKVSIMETRPISKTKHFVLLSKIGG
jgi:small subunit ribosomal protein S17